MSDLGDPFPVDNEVHHRGGDHDYTTPGVDHVPSQAAEQDIRINR